MKETEIRSALSGMAQETLADALAVVLARGEAPRERVAGSGRPELANFAQAVLYLKKNYDFEELDLFSTEADLVYVQTTDRRIQLSGRPGEARRSASGVPAAAAPGITAGDQVPDEASKPSADRGRFSNLEI